MIFFRQVFPSLKETSSPFSYEDVEVISPSHLRERRLLLPLPFDRATLLSPRSSGETPIKKEAIVYSFSFFSLFFSFLVSMRKSHSFPPACFLFPFSSCREGRIFFFFCAHVVWPFFFPPFPRVFPAGKNLFLSFLRRGNPSALFLPLSTKIPS